MMTTTGVCSLFFFGCVLLSWTAAVVVSAADAASTLRTGGGNKHASGLESEFIQAMKDVERERNLKRRVLPLEGLQERLLAVAKRVPSSPFERDVVMGAAGRSLEDQQQANNRNNNNYGYNYNYNYNKNKNNNYGNGNNNNNNANGNNNNYYNNNGEEDSQDGYGYGSNYYSKTKFLADYALKYAGCQNVHSFSDYRAAVIQDGQPLDLNRYVLLRMCPKDKCEDRGHRGCRKDFGDYMLPMEDYLNIMAQYRFEELDQYCTICKQCMEAKPEMTEDEMKQQYYEDLSSEQEYYENQYLQGQYGYDAQYDADFNQYNQQNYGNGNNYADEQYYGSNNNNQYDNNNNNNGNHWWNWDSWGSSNNNNNDNNGGYNNNVDNNGYSSNGYSSNGGYNDMNNNNAYNNDMNNNNVYGNNGYQQQPQNNNNYGYNNQQQNYGYNNGGYRSRRRAQYYGYDGNANYDGNYDPNYDQYYEGNYVSNYDADYDGDYDADYTGESGCVFEKVCSDYKKACRRYDTNWKQLDYYFQCTPFKTNGRVVYLGPQCLADGQTIKIGIFSDNECSTYTGDLASVLTGWQGVSGSLFENNDLSIFTSPKCISCDADDVKNLAGDYNAHTTNPLCGMLYQFSAKCNANYDYYRSGLLSDSEAEVEEDVCNMVSALKENHYSEFGEVKLDDPYANMLVKLGDYRHISFRQFLLLMASILVCLALLYYAFQLHKMIGVRSLWKRMQVRAQEKSTAPIDEATDSDSDKESSPVDNFAAKAAAAQTW